jgi:glutaredoxin
MNYMKLVICIFFMISFMSAGLAWGELNGSSDGYGELSSASSDGRVLMARDDASGHRDMASARPKVEVFMTSWCGYCRKMIQFLKEKGIPYSAYDIEADSAAAKVYDDMGVRGVPIVRIGTHIVHGYDPESVMYYYNGED